MGYRKVPTIYDLEFEGALEGLNVRVKSVKFGKVRRLIALMDSDEKDVEVMEEITKSLVDAIVSWDYQDEHGNDIPATAEGIDELEFADVLAIVNAWLDKITGPTEELGKDSPSGSPFPGQPATMEAL